MKPTATYPDVERATVDLLTELLEDLEPDVTVGVSLPTGWTIDTGEHLQVSCDGTPLVTHPVVAHSTIRIVAWAVTTSRAKELANLALAVLAAHTGDPTIAVILPLAGVFPARDPDNRAELASVLLRVSVRSTPVT